MKNEQTKDKPDLKEIYPNKLNINSISFSEYNKSLNIFIY